MEFLTGLSAEIQMTWEGVRQAAGEGHLLLLAVALLVACGFEFINGFHDTANAVATVIYTRSLKPWKAVIWSGFCNFVGVFVGGIAVAIGIVKLLPVDLLVSQNMSVSLAMVFALLASAIAWNLGTWYFGIPASSSHTLIGAILGIGLANAYVSGAPLSQGVNWSKAGDIGLALLISPLIGFAIAALLLQGLKRLLRDPIYHAPAAPDRAPPWRVRLPLILTSTGVSLAHGSNDGQKGVGLIMLILIAILPAQYAVRGSATPSELARAQAASSRIVLLLKDTTIPEVEAGTLVSAANAAGAARVMDPAAAAAAKGATAVSELLKDRAALSSLDRAEKLALRSQIMKLDSKLSSLEKSGAFARRPEVWSQIQGERKALKSLTDYSPLWVIVVIAISLGLGTMVGWKRIVVTVGEKIGKAHMSYAQGAAAELVAASTIGISAFAGLPVSTTHTLSSGVAGAMVGGGTGIQGRTVRNIFLAWVLTLPVTIILSAGLFVLFHSLIA